MVDTTDKELYAIAAREVAQGTIDQGLWGKAFADSAGQKPAAEALYLKMRVSELRRHRASMLALQLQQKAELKAKADNEADERMRRQRPIAYTLQWLARIVSLILFVALMGGLGALVLSLLAKVGWFPK